MTDIRMDGNYLNGNPIKIHNISKNWHQVDIAPDSFYMRDGEYQEALKQVIGEYTDMSTGREACVRFAHEEDAVVFRMKYSHCV